MLKRLTWFGIGAAAGASGMVWAQQKVKRQIDALGPDHVVVTAGNQARRVGRQVGRTVAGAVSDGRSAMRDREDELVARRDGQRPDTRQNHTWPTSSPRDPGRDRPTRPASW